MSENGYQGLALEQRQRLKLSQQHLRYVKMLELNAPELEEAVEKELADNPALVVNEDDSESRPEPRQSDSTPYYLRSARNSSPDDRTPDFSPADEEETLFDYLLEQIQERSIPLKVAEVARYLAGSVDSNGYIRRPLLRIMDDMEFNLGVHVDEDTAREALALIQSLDPAGVGAFDLKECLELQLERRPQSQTRDDALRILREKFDAFSMKHYHKIVSGLAISKERAMEGVDLIRSLNPKPGAAYSSSQDDFGNIIIPDFIVENHDGELTISLNNRLPELQIDRSFSEAVDQLRRNRENRKSSNANKEKEYLFNRFNDARDFINILRNRQQTMMDVMTAITQIQKEYFLTEDVDRMKPMMIKDISKLTGFDISTVSRATANKYVGTSWGIFPLRHFFSDTIGSEEDGLTNRRIEAEISRLVADEDKRHPLSDEKICRMLNDKGFDVSRRTVAKYRDRKGIPVARLRKEM